MAVGGSWELHGAGQHWDLLLGVLHAVQRCFLLPLPAWGGVPLALGVCSLMVELQSGFELSQDCHSSRCYRDSQPTSVWSLL